MLSSPQMFSQNWISIPSRFLGGLPFHEILNATICKQQHLLPQIMPDLRQTDRIFITSDYGGEQKESMVESYAFLFFDADSFTEWDESRRQFRLETGLDDRIFKYSTITDEDIVNLQILLRIHDLLKGLLVTFVINKELKSLFSEKGFEDYDQLRTEPFVKYPPEQKEKIFRIGSFIGIVLGALTRENQNVLWIPDKDNTTNNPTRLIAVRNQIKEISSNFLPHKLNWFEPGDLIEVQSKLHIEDLNAVTDIAAGASARYFSDREEQNLNSQILKTPEWPKNILPKVKIIIDWLRRNSSNLKRKVFYFHRGEPPVDNLIKDIEYYFYEHI